MTPERFLSESIRLARAIEREIPLAKLMPHKARVGYGLLVRQRRLAEAIEVLGTRHAYEGRMLLRSMIEMLINYSWIRAVRGHSRALRFLRYDPSERRDILREVAVVLPGPRAQQALAHFTKERTDTRHLFRIRDPKTGRTRWAKGWASKTALADRLIEVLDVDAAEAGKPRSDAFMYGLYKWTSSAVHGGPVSLSECVHRVGSRLVARRQPERKPTAQLLTAGMMLLATIDRLTADARFRQKHRGRLKALTDQMRPLAEASRRRGT